MCPQAVCLCCLPSRCALWRYMCWIHPFVMLGAGLDDSASGLCLFVCMHSPCFSQTQQCQGHHHAQQAACSCRPGGELMSLSSTQCCRQEGLSRLQLCAFTTQRGMCGLFCETVRCKLSCCCNSSGNMGDCFEHRSWFEPPPVHPFNTEEHSCVGLLQQQAPIKTTRQVNISTPQRSLIPHPHSISSRCAACLCHGAMAALLMSWCMLYVALDVTSHAGWVAFSSTVQCRNH